MTRSPAFCSSCGEPASGRFCSNCGNPLEPGAKPAPAPGGVPLLWLVAAGLVALAAVGLLVWDGRAPAAPAAPAAVVAPVAGTPPDLSQMTPRERFDRLFNRIMTAAESSDTAEVKRFLPMAMMAFAQLETVDADARYHLAMLALQGDDPEAALAQADTIAAAVPRHLFTWLIREAEAARRGDAVAVRAAREGFLAAYDGEIALERVEYAEHRSALERFRNQR
jgi:hypothetical protein